MYDLSIFRLVRTQLFTVDHNLTTSSIATRDDPLLHNDPLRLSISRLSKAAESDFGYFGDRVHQNCTDYNSFKKHHNQAPSFRGSRARYYQTWDAGASKILSNSEKIKVKAAALYTKWGPEGTLQLWDTLEELREWWDAVYIRLDSWISEVNSLERPVLVSWQEAEEKPQPPRPQINQWLQDKLAADKVIMKEAEQAQAKSAPQGTEESTPENEQRPPRQPESLGHTGMRAQIQSHTAPSSSQAEQRKAVTGPTRSDRPSDGRTSHKRGPTDDPEPEDVISPPSHRRYASTASATSEITRSMDAMHISPAGTEPATATRSAVQPPRDNVNDQPQAHHQINW